MTIAERYIDCHAMIFRVKAVYYKPHIAAIPPLLTCYNMLNIKLRG